MKKLSSGACRRAAAMAIFVFCAGTGFAVAQNGDGGPSAYGYAADPEAAGDSIRTVSIADVHVTSTRAGDKYPVAAYAISSHSEDPGYFHMSPLSWLSPTDLPFLLQTMPSAVVTSDAGNGTGYTGIRIRGADASRINVTANGIPINDAESHSVFWVNMPDFMASLDNIQVQSGVGTSTNGAGAFGASINMQTKAFAGKRYAQFSGAYGSFNTHRESVEVGTGLIRDKWAVSARLSNIGSDGYIERASTKLKSYMVQAGFFSGGTSVKFITFGGKEETYHAWDGVSREQLHSDRRYNGCGEIWGFRLNPDGSLYRDASGNPADSLLGYYDDQTDNYTQSNYQLLFSQRLSDRFNFNFNLHYTKGDGYYEEYKNGRTLEEYGLKPFAPANPANEPYYDSKSGTVTKSNLVRRKMMDNWFGGGVFSLDYKSPKLEMSLGGAANRYEGDHWGRVLWVQSYSGDPGYSYDHKYYDNTGKKTDVNVYLKANWEAAKGLYLFGDVQYRHINYSIEGDNDNWDWNAGKMQSLDIDHNFDFFNPKAGVYYQNGRWSGFASVAIAHKEPTRNNYTDADPSSDPRKERLTDYEWGVEYRSQVFSARANFYYMDYKDQLVLTGQVNHIGEPLSENVPDSYRMGVEMMFSAKITPWLWWNGNASFSRNKIKHYTDYTSDPNYNMVATYLGTTDIAYSPEVLLGSALTFKYKGFNATFSSNFVGHQWVTNSAGEYGYSTAEYAYAPGEERPERLRLSSYFVSNLHLEYTFKVRAFEELALGVSINNIFDRDYCSNGYGWSEFVDDGAGGLKRRNTMMYFPQAGTNVQASIVLKF